MSQNTSIGDRLEFMGLDQKARETLRSLQPLLKQEVGPALAHFYDKVRKTPETRKFFRDESQMTGAAGRQQSHWDIIAQGEFGDTYVKAVRTVGQVHARIGLEPRWYIGGYAVVTEHLIRAALKSFWPKGFMRGKQARQMHLAGDALAAMTKATLLDMDLAISVYLEALAEKRIIVEDEQKRIAAEDQLAITELALGLKALAAGDLTHRIHADFSPKTSALKSDFNSAIAKLQESMGKVADNTAAIRSGTDEISAAADDLSRRTEQQAASLEETAAALDEITATVRKTSEGATHARGLVGKAKTDAEHSGQVVLKAVDAMSGIEKSSNQISQIIGVIDEIAFQTNLLALNAGVEAARAGDAGRGFAVVASEVRALAQRSAEAAKEIKTLISASSAQVEQGVDLVAETGKALERIFGQINEINGIVGDIAASAQEQATGLDQVNTAVNQMDQVTQQNAAMVEESTAASHSLSQETAKLAELIGMFQIGHDGAQAGNRRAAHRAPVKAAPRPKAAARPVAAMKTVGHGGAARKPEPDASASDWQEF